MKWNRKTNDLYMSFIYKTKTADSERKSPV